MASEFRPRIFTAADEASMVDSAIGTESWGQRLMRWVGRVVGAPAFVAGRLWQVSAESFRNGRVY